MDIEQIRKDYKLSEDELYRKLGIHLPMLKQLTQEPSQCSPYVNQMIRIILDTGIIQQNAPFPPSKQPVDRMTINHILKKDLEMLTKEECSQLTEAIVEQMLTEFKYHDRGGLYGYMQRNLAYNSNRIEGNKLTEDETALLFDTGEILSDGEVVYRAKDIEEMNGHFLMFNQMLKTMDAPLSAELIKSFHFQLEAGVFEFRANGYVPGEYKRRENTVGGITTSHPKEVSSDMDKLLNMYNQNDGMHTIEDMAGFHARYETIHPFQDGNGRTGRIILFRESLCNGILPFIVRDENKVKYYMALKSYQNRQDLSKLTDYFKQEQAALYDKIQHYMYDHALDYSAFDDNLDR